MASTQGFASHLAPGIREVVGTNLMGRESYYSRLLKVETSARNYEGWLAASGLPAAPEKPELQAIQSYDPLEGGTKRLSHTVYAIGFEVSEEAWEDDLYAGKGSALRDAATGLADSLAEVAEIQGARFFNSEAWATATVATFARTLPDNSSTVGVYNTAHGVIAGGEAGTQSNRPSTDVDLTVTSYRAGLTQFRKWKNDRNMRIPGFTEPAMLVVAPDSEWDAREILQSANRPDTANNVENVTKGATGLTVHPYMD